MVTTRRSFLKNLGLGQRGSSVDKDNQLKGLLGSLPGEYFVWKNKEILFSSGGLATLFNVQDLKSVEELYGKMRTEDAAEFRKKITDFEQNGSQVEMITRTQDDKEIRLLAKKVEIEGEPANILWVEDLTQILSGQAELTKKAELSEQQLYKFQRALQSIDTPVCIYDVKGQITWCNPFYAQLFQADIPQILKKQTTPSLKSATEKKKIDVTEKVAAAFESRKEGNYEVTTVLSGKRYRFAMKVAPATDKKFTVVSFFDKTSEENMTADTKRTESAYNALLENLQTAVSLFNADQEIIFYNSAFAKLWQLEEAWLNTRPKLGDILEKLRETRRLPEQADFRSYKHEWLARFTKLLEPHSDVLVLPDGTVLRSQTIPNPAGGLMLIFEDVTSNLELESSYNTLIAVQRETLNNLKEGVIVFGGDGRLQLWNPTFLQLFDLNPEELEKGIHFNKLSERMRRYYDEQTWLERRNKLLHLLETRSSDSGVIRRNDDKILSYVMEPLPDGGMLITYSDITDSVNVEEALREKNRALETAEKLKSEFLANVSYQLRTPLNAIMGFNEILANEFFGELNVKQKEYTRDIDEAGKRLKQLIDDVLDLTSIEAGKLALNKVNTQVCELLASVKSMGEEWAMGKQLKFEVDCSASVGTVYADQQRLKQVLMHLLRNAIAYTPEKGKVSLSAHRDNGTIKIIMQDTGIGISQDDLTRLFEPFEIGTTKMHDPSRTGAGLGLTLVRNIIGLHKGKIDIDSEEGEGTKITLSFPEKA